MASLRSQPRAEQRDRAALLRPIIDQIVRATAAAEPLQLIGGGTKAFYGGASVGTPLELSPLSGSVAYEPTELVITADAGTPLLEIKRVLAEGGQMLAFEPPCLGPSSTIGGVVASGLSGPRRPYAGAARDGVLGVQLINGRGEVLRFGGQVMKNVAGYDISRLMVGALGTLGPLIEVSLRVHPRPECERTLQWALDSTQAQRRMLALVRQPWPISAMSHDGEYLRVRISGSERHVVDSATKLAPDNSTDADDFWCGLRDFSLPFFQQAQLLWRLSLPPAAPNPTGVDTVLCDWGGALRWIAGDFDADGLRDFCAEYGGHATLFRGGPENGSSAAFTPLPPALHGIHQRLKRAFDPAGVFNRGRLYTDL